MVPRARLSYRGATFEEMDLDAVLARAPAVALVDELAHTNVPGSRHEKRWQDVDALLDAGIDVITTVNIQHLESLNDVVQRISGVEQRETIPDEVVRRADQIEIVDISPEALAAGWPTATSTRPSGSTPRCPTTSGSATSSALRELALLWVAERVDEGLSATAPRTASTSPGRPASGSSSRCREAPRARPCYGGPSASPPGRPARTCWPSTS